MPSTLDVLIFFRGNKNLCLHLISFLHTDMPQVVEILPQVKQGLAYIRGSQGIRSHDIHLDKLG